ncbi:MAG: carboxypeptidase-like regulatory domain-containing protein, partial [Acidobacteria bacterium]|nr:carboxypeptidase-like regulatory domain-containing protein [Acidobacteriota bacterium]
MFVFLLLFMALSLAQAGEIHGRVLNQDGDAVPAARVTVEREDGQFHHEVRAEAGGVYQIEGLGQGIYSITVSGPSGRPSLRREVVVGTPDSSVQLDFRLPQVAEQAAAEQDEG